jgi:heme exporter protein B
LVTELKQELRSKAALSAMVLYVIATVFTVYMCIKTNDDRTFNALIWVVMLFVCMNLVARSFFQIQASRFNYYYTTVHPVAFLFSKIIYNTLLTLGLAILTWALFSVLFGVHVDRFLLFFFVLINGTAAITATLTMLSAIAAKANSTTLLAVLSFPILIPILMLVQQLSLAAFTDMKLSGLYGDFIALAAMHVLVYVLGGVLFPYLWKD